MTELIIAVIGSGALSAVISGVFTLVLRKKQREDGVSAGVRQLLYDRIKYLCKEHIARGYIASNDLEDLSRMHKIYHDDLAGNGFLDDLMAEVRRSKTLAGVILAGDLLLSLATLGVTVLAILRDFTGGLPYLVALIGIYNVATGYVLGKYFDKSRAENTAGGIVYDTAMNGVKRDA